MPPHPTHKHTERHTPVAKLRPSKCSIGTLEYSHKGHQRGLLALLRPSYPITPFFVAAPLSSTCVLVQFIFT